MTDFLLLAFTFLIAGVIAVPIATRFGLGSVLGYLIAGIAISPLLGVLSVDVVSIQHFAEFGVVMMLFLVGLELEPRRLWDMRGQLLGLGGLQVVGTALVITATAFALGLSGPIALTVGLVLSLSSTAIVLQTFNEKGLMRSDAGQAGFSILLFQDIAVIPMLALIPLLAIPELVEALAHGDPHGTTEHGGTLSLVAHLPGWAAGLVTLASVGAVVLVGGFLTRPLFRFIARTRLRELFVAAALMMVIGIALLMSLVGLSPALGTFIAGVVLANSEYRHELESDIDPFRGLLLGLFFMTVGAGINFVLLFNEAWLMIGLTLGLITIKAAVLFLLAVLFKVRGANRWLLALGLAQAGEFGFVLLSFTVANAVLPPDIAERLSLIVAMSMLLTPLLFIIHDRLIAPHFSSEQSERDEDAIAETHPIIIAGRGRVGGIVDRMLHAAGFNTTVVDYSYTQLDMLRTFGMKAYFGDATRPDLLHAAGIAEARLLIVAIDNRDQINALVSYALHTYPDLHVIARAVDRDHVYRLYELGCRDIIRETYDSSIRIGRSAFEALGIEHERAMEMARTFDMTDRRSMVEVADVYDTTIPAHENKELVARVKAIAEEWEPDLRRKMDDIRLGRTGTDKAP